MTSTITQNRRSPLETSGWVGAIANAVATVVTVLGRINSWKGFSPDDNDTSALGAVSVVVYVVGFLVAVGCAIALTVKRRPAARGLWIYIALDVLVTVLFTQGLFD